MAQFKDLKTSSGLSELDRHLATSSYIDGWVVSDADSVTFAALSGPPTGHAHALRWYNNIASFSKEEKTKWPKACTSAATCGGAVAAVSNGKAAAADEDEDIDLFGESDEEDSGEKERIKQERLAAYADKKSKKHGPIAKSSVVFDVKPWDDECDLVEMEKLVRQIQHDGLLWGAAKLVPVAFGIKKLQIGCVVEDDKVSIDMLEEEITALEDFVQSVDIAAFNKI